MASMTGNKEGQNFGMKKYKVILADPPWEYDDKRNNAGKNNPTGAGGAIKHYPLMKIDDICNLKIQKIADDDCMLFLWVTSPMMEKAFKVVNAWGFKYCTIVFVWIKMKNDFSDYRKDGIGNYTLSNAEYVLLARKGKYWRNSTKVKQIIFSPKPQIHSRKPSEVRKRIEELCGNVPRIELFARDRIDGWDVWGNEAPNFTQLSLRTEKV